MVLLPFPMSANLEGELSKTNPVLKLMRSRLGTTFALFVALLYPIESFSETCAQSSALTCTDSTPCKTINGVQVCLSTVSPLPQGALQYAKPCWTAQASYACTSTSIFADNCGMYTSDPKCGILSSTCIEPNPANPAQCLAYTDNYQCQIGGGVQFTNNDCSGQTYCTNGVCFTKRDKPNDSLGKAVAAMEVSRMAGFYADQGNPAAPQIFSGQMQWCSENSIGLANCCKPDDKGMSYTNALITEELIKAGWNNWIREVVGSSYTFDSLFDAGMGFIDKAITGMTEVLNGTSAATGQAVQGAANTTTGAANAAATPATTTPPGTAGATQPAGAGTGGAIGGAIGTQVGTTLASNNGANQIWTGVAGAGGYAGGTVGGTYVGAYAYSLVTTGSTATAASASTSAVVSICWVCIIVMVIIMIIMAVLACDMPEIKTQMKKGAGLCYEVGKYCNAKNEFNQCQTYRHTNCCFNSKLGRIIQVQGRPQLGIPWGDVKNPDCRGFTVDELQQLDFSQMDLSEFVSSVVAKATPDAAGIAANVNQRVNNFFASGAVGLTNGVLPSQVAFTPVPISVEQNLLPPSPALPSTCSVVFAAQPPTPDGDITGTFTLQNCLAGGTATWNYVGTCPAIPTGTMNQTTGAAFNMPITPIDVSGSSTFTYTVPAACFAAATPSYVNTWKAMISDPNAGFIGSVNAFWP